MDLITCCLEAITYFATKKNASKCYELFLHKLPALKQILRALEIPYEATIAIQHSTYTLSDFYGSWLKMERSLNKLVLENLECECKFALALVGEVEKRKKILLNNQALISAVYLDPRFNFKLSAEEIRIAKITIEKLFDRLKVFKSSASAQVEMATKTDDDSFEDDCVASGLPRAFHGKSTTQVVDQYFFSANISRLFENYERSDRLHHKDSVLSFWVERKIDDPVLYELASIIQAIPPTQATVERAFSALGCVFNHKTSSLSDSSLENILMIVLNKELVDPIHKRDVNALLTIPL